jgi:hypothetical protein
LKDIVTIDPMIDDIAAMIDEALAQPEHADAVKRKIRERLARRSSSADLTDPSDEESVEEFWENVPI